jgi:hypothetical protein
VAEDLAVTPREAATPARLDAPDARLSRRALLEVLASFVFAGLSGGSASAAPTPARTAASGPAPLAHASAAAALTPTSLIAAAAQLDAAQVLDESLGEAFLEALSVRVGVEPLARLVTLVQSTAPEQIDREIESAGLESAAREVVAAFYSGLVGHGPGEKLVTYLFALVWGAAPFTKPPSLCGGIFGYWANPPAPALQVPAK